MDYEQFFPPQTTNECGREHRIIGFFVFVTVVSILVDVVSYCRTNRKLRDLQNENESLKSLILKTVDRTLVRMMKNGNDSDDEHED